MDNLFTVPVSSMDLAALLCTVGFEMKQFEIIHHIKMEDKDKREKTAIFEFSNETPQGLSLSKVKNNYIFPDKNTKATHFAQLAKIAAHNYQVLKSVIKENRPLQQIQGENYTILKNMNGSPIPTIVKSLGNNNQTQDLQVIAVASALGNSICGYSIENETLTVYFENEIDEVIREFEVDTDDESMDYLSILVNTFKNRKFLMEETWAKHTLHLSNGYKQVIVNKEMGEKLKKKVLEFLN